MIRDQDVLDPRRVPRYTSPRAARSAPTRQRRPLPDRRRPARAHRGNGRFVAVAVLAAITLAGIVTVRSVTRPDFDRVVAADEVLSVNGPRVSVPREMVPSEPGFVNTLRGLADGAVRLRANGEPVELDSGGGFAVHIPQSWTKVRLVAIDRAGGRTERVVTITPQPTPVEQPSTIAVHVTIEEWVNPGTHDQIVEMARTGLINAVQLDIKDDDGEVGYDTKVRLAHRAGAVSAYYDAREALDELHGLGVRVIGRIVNFFDPILARWAWENGRPEMVVLDGSGGQPLENSYGPAAFTNFAHPEVRQYQIDLAVEAAGLGFDEILYDYVRRPEGDMSEMTFSGLDMPPDVSIARFVKDSKAALKGTDALLGVSVFGVSAKFPQDTAQDTKLLAPLVDYVSPMVYPALWGSGQYGVDDPDGRPGDIVGRSLADFERVIAGSGAGMVPWLQAWAYGPEGVHAQIDAAAAQGANGYILWQVKARYDPAMLKPI